MDIGLAPPFLRCFDQSDRIVNAAPGINELALA